MTDGESFALASRAFDLFTLAEREKALTVFSSLRYPSIADRFIESVHRVIVEKPSPPSVPPQERS